MRPVPELVEYIRSLCKENGTSLTKLEEELHFANGTIGRWKTGKRYPAHDKLLLIAKRFGMPLSELTQETDKKEKPTADSGEPKDDTYMQLKDFAMTASPEELAEMKNFMEFIKSKRRPK